MKIPLYSPTIYRNEMEAVLNRMVEEEVGPGDSNRELSNKISEHFGGVYAVAFRSPAVAFSYALTCLNIQSNSSVIISALAPYWMCVELQKMKINPIFIDTYQDGVFMNIKEIRDNLENVVAIIVSEPLGLMPQMEEIKSLNLPIIEDISQSMGASMQGVKAGSLGDFAILGLEEHDIITGGGGAVLIANTKAMQTSLKALSSSFLSIELMPDMNASLALIQLRQSSKNTSVKLEFLLLYQKALLQTNHHTFTLNEDSVNPIYSFPVIFNSNINDIEKFVEKKDVEIRKAFEDSIIANLKELQEKFINATSMMLRTYLFPLYPRLGKKKAVEIAKILSVLP